MEITRMSESRRAELSLLAITVVWGLTFVMVKKTLETMSPFVFMSYRFLLATLVMLPFCVRKLRRVDRGMLMAGAFLGALLYAAYAFQTFGLERTAAGNAGFITGLFVVFVPALSVLILKQRPDGRSIAAVAVALVGLSFLTLQHEVRLNWGDVLVLGCALTYSFHIIYLSGYAKKYDLTLLTLVQMAVVAVAMTGSAAAFESFTLPRGALAWATIVICGVVASSLAFYVQARAQRVLSPVRVSVVLIMEPVFSVLFGILLLGERLTWRGWLGCGLMLAAMLISELRPEREAPRGGLGSASGAGEVLAQAPAEVDG
jgi:drug/metabolite transporter (DMT)-like permease